MIADVARFTPDGLVFDEARHRYTLAGRELISVTTALVVAGLVDRAWFKPEDAARGLRAHAAIHLANAGHLRDDHLDDTIRPFVLAYLAFLADSGFRVDASEEPLADPALMAAGTLDLRGQFIDAGTWLDVIDVKTGAVPPWVGYQTAGYARLLPLPERRRVRRWVLHLRENGRYTLNQLTKRSDEAVFLAAVTVAQAKRGWL